MIKTEQTLQTLFGQSFLTIIKEKPKFFHLILFDFKSKLINLAIEIQKKLFI